MAIRSRHNPVRVYIWRMGETTPTKEIVDKAEMIQQKLDRGELHVFLWDEKED